MSILFYHKLRKSNSAHTYYAVHRLYPTPRQKVASLKIDGSGCRTITPHPGGAITDAETRMAKAFLPVC
jgi:hypothetical protein